MSISSKPYKQWCKARGLDFMAYISKFPFVYEALGLKYNYIQPVIKTGFSHRLADFIKKTVGQLKSTKGNFSPKEN